MVKVNDRVYHVYNMGLRGVVTRLEQEQTQTHLAAGPAQARLVAIVATADGKAVRIPVADLMRDD